PAPTACPSTPLFRSGPADLAGLRDAFVGGVPDGGRMFDPHVERSDSARLDITLRRCPLKDAWHEAGVPECDVATLCRIAGRVDKIGRASCRERGAGR